MWRTEGLETVPALPHLVPAAVMLRGGTVVLQHLGDGALIDALKVQLPLPKFQETPENREARPYVVPSHQRPGRRGADARVP